MSLGRCDGCDKPLTSEHMRTVDAHQCAECLEDPGPLVKPRIMVRMRARYAGICHRCRGRIERNAVIGYDVATRKALHANCADNLEAADERQALPL